MERRRSEGVRRLFLILSILSILSWLGFIFYKIETHPSSLSISKIEFQGWLIILGGIPVVYFIPQGIKVIGYWLIDGFRKDKTTG